MQKQFPFISSYVKDADALAKKYYDGYGRRERVKIQKQLDQKKMS